MKSVVDRIKTLVELRDKGSISKEEFDQMLALLEQELHRENKDASALNTDRAPQNIEPSGKRKTVLFVSVAGMLILFVLGFFTMVPAFLWDSDGDGFHNYRNDNCPAVSGTCQGCLDSDNDGFADSEDERPKESSKTQAPPTIDDTQKLQNGEAVMVPSEFGNYVVTKKWLRLKNKRYENSDYEKMKFKPVSKNETVEKLNDFYGLQVPLPEQGPTPPGEKPPKKDPKPKKAGLTSAEEAELNILIVKEKNGGLLTNQELARMKMLEMKRH